MSSLEELKGLDLNQLKEEEEGECGTKNNNNNNNNGGSKSMVVFPQRVELGKETRLFEVGPIIQIVGDLVIIEASNPNLLVDFDNWIYAENREVLGFVIDIFGKV